MDTTEMTEGQTTTEEPTAEYRRPYEDGKYRVTVRSAVNTICGEVGIILENWRAEYVAAVDDDAARSAIRGYVQALYDELIDQSHACRSMGRFMENYRDDEPDEYTKLLEPEQPL